MATLTTHVLDSVNGAHAAGVGVALYRIESSGAKTTLFNAATDANGRLRQTLPPDAVAAGMTCELVFQVADYFAAQPAALGGTSILCEAVFRFSMPDPSGAYHIPLMLSPSGYSVWYSQSAVPAQGVVDTQ